MLSALAYTGGLPGLDAYEQVTEAFPFDQAPRYQIRDRDSIYGDEFRRRIEGLGIEEILIAHVRPGRIPIAND